MGRTRREAHCGFLRFLQQNGWLEAMARPSSAPEDWIRVIDQYIGIDRQEGKYYEWMRNYVGMRWIALHLDDYCHLLQNADRLRSFSPASLFCPRASAELDGTGIAPPPIDKVLGIGALFVVRELVRTGRIKSLHAWPYCYVPTYRVRRLLTWLGCGGLEGEAKWDQSASIFRFLCDSEALGQERATFNGAYDLPLLMACEDPSLRDGLKARGLDLESWSPEWE